MDCILAQTTSLNKFKKFQVIQNIFSDHNRIKLKLKTDRYLKKYKYGSSQVTLVNKPWMKEKVLKKKNFKLF